MTSIRSMYITTMAAALALGTSSAFAGAEPASPTPIVPPPPPSVTTMTPAPVTLTPSEIQAAQTLVQTSINDLPTSIPLNLQIRTVNVLRAVLASPEVLAQIGFTPSQIEALIAQIEAIPTFD